MGIFRSEAMSSGTLVLPVEKAREYVEVLGSSANLEYQDLHADQLTGTFSRPFRHYIQRVDDTERKLLYLVDECKRQEMTIHTSSNQSFEGFLEAETQRNYTLDKIERDVNSCYSGLVALKDNNARLIEIKNKSVEERAVLESASKELLRDGQTREMRTAHMMNMGGSSSGSTFEATGKLMLVGNSSGGDAVAGVMNGLGFNNIAGVLDAQDQARFSRFLFRSTFGNAYTHFSEIPTPMMDPETGKQKQRLVFVVYYQGNTRSALHDRILKVCTQFGASTYPWVSSVEEARTRLQELVTAGNEKERALMASERLIKDDLATLLGRTTGSGNSLIEDWRLYLLKEKGIYRILNRCEGEGPTLRASVWYPSVEEDSIRRLLIHQSRQSHCTAMLITDRMPDYTESAGMHGVKMPPTYFRECDVTTMPHVIVNTYGVPRYQEITPAIFTVVSFPFSFGIMFGDVGHGFLMMLFGLLIIFKYNEEVKRFKLLHEARFMLTLMGFFSFFAGWMYCDMFGMGVNLFGTRWMTFSREDDDRHMYVPNFDPTNKGQTLVEVGAQSYTPQFAGPHPFGVDPVWHGAENELLFLNSLKMKISVLFGVCQMLLGLGIRLCNIVFEKNMIDMYCEFLPMIVWLTAFFGYMDWMIMHKWVNAIDGTPSILNALIGMVMGKSGQESIPELNKDGNPMGDLYAGQAHFEGILLTLMVLSVPLLLLPKPFLLKWKAEQRLKRIGGGVGVRPNFQRLDDGIEMNEASVLPRVVGDSTSTGSPGDGGGVAGGGVQHPNDRRGDSKKHQFDFADCFIHQAIETIEFVLGSIAHTASYLRLWALSLAHQQLSLVFFNMTVKAALEAETNFIFMAIQLYTNFAMWLTITVGLFFGMDTLECFMHTLRLHWVEFQSKFYRGDGHLFLPYRHVTILNESMTPAE